MAQALLTAVGVGIAGLVAAAVYGLRGVDLARHISFGLFATLVTLLAHSMMMFYLIGKGKAVKDAMLEGHLTGDHYQRIAAIRKPDKPQPLDCARSALRLPISSARKRIFPPLMYIPIPKSWAG